CSGTGSCDASLRKDSTRRARARSILAGERRSERSPPGGVALVLRQVRLLVIAAPCLDLCCRPHELEPLVRLKKCRSLVNNNRLSSRRPRLPPGLAARLAGRLDRHLRGRDRDAHNAATPHDAKRS